MTPAFLAPISEGGDTSLAKTRPRRDGHSSFPGQIPSGEGTLASPLTGPGARGGGQEEPQAFRKGPWKELKLFSDGPGPRKKTQDF